jgi:hypothetical protein
MFNAMRIVAVSIYGKGSAAATVQVRRSAGVFERIKIFRDP